MPDSQGATSPYLKQRQENPLWSFPAKKSPFLPPGADPPGEHRRLSVRCEGGCCFRSSAPGPLPGPQVCWAPAVRQASGPQGKAEGAPAFSAVLFPCPHKLGPPPAVPQVTTVTRPNQTHRRKRVPYHPPPPTVQRALTGESTCSGYRRRKNQNYFPQGCELERIKPNLGTLSALCPT